MIKWVKLSIGLSLLFLVVACSKNSGGVEPSKTGDTAGKREVVAITLMPPSWDGLKWRDDHPIIEYINKKFDVKLKIMWTDGATYKDKLNVLAASGNLPDSYRVEPENFVAWQKEGAFLDLEPLLPNYPTLSATYPDETWDLLNPKGNRYGMPMGTTPIRDSYQIREDWLENVGIPMPKEDSFTVDDFYKIIKAFGTADPNKSGKKDTLGFSISNDLGNSTQLKAAFGLANGWQLVDGKLISAYEQPKEMKDYLGFLHKLYAEDLLDKDFINKVGLNVYGDFQAGRLGIYTSYSAALRSDSEKLRSIQPSAKLVQLPPPIGPSGLRGNPTKIIGDNKIVINGTIDKDKQARILEIYDWWASDEGTSIMLNGFEDSHYKKNADGNYEVLPLTETDLPRLMTNFFFARGGLNHSAFIYTDPTLIDFDKAYLANNEKYPYPNAAAGIQALSPAYQEKWKNLDIKFRETQLKIIIGKEPMDSLEAAISEWKTTGGDQITKEINEAYQTYK
ncbi:extracellular solute-binding protein [Paenibacillus luteus]|uniref:extracellular solute-binding protein n=1 Tax=Paenibacillus luteus TaxID=2545753 RepID=UPI001141B14D|nr:extracellular solute-binding protein [Paenibacillus luteus]